MPIFVNEYYQSPNDGNTSYMGELSSTDLSHSYNTYIKMLLLSSNFCTPSRYTPQVKSQKTLAQLGSLMEEPNRDKAHDLEREHSERQRRSEKIKDIHIDEVWGVHLRGTLPLATPPDRRDLLPHIPKITLILT